MAKYVHDDLNNRIESMSKEEIYSLIDEVIESGELPTDAQTAFVTALKSIVDGKPYKIGFCTQAEYNELVANDELVEDALYIITDDSSYDDLLALINNAIADFEATIDALPRTNELMQAASSESTFNIELVLNDMANINNPIEISGYIVDTSSSYKYYFTHKIYAYVNGAIQPPYPRGESIIILDSGKIDETEIAKVVTYVMKTTVSGNLVYKLNATISNISKTSTASYTFNITSVKELINY